MIQGWNWYAGADPSQIGASQYDFQTTVAHELGHALGLGGSTDPNSPMYETLAAGVVNRTVTTQDLNIPVPPEGADPQMAAGFRPSTPTAVISAALGSASAAGEGVAGLMPLDHDAVVNTWPQARAAARHRPVSRDRIPGPSSLRGRPLVLSAGPRRPPLQARLVDAVLSDTGMSRSLQPFSGNGDPTSG
jgi:hypothetical protein